MLKKVSNPVGEDPSGSELESASPADEEDPVRDHAARGDTQTFGRDGNRRASRTEREVQKPGPGTGQAVDVDVVGGVDPAADHGDLPLPHSLAPVEIGQPQSLVTERRLDQADVAQVEAETAGRHVGIAVAVLDLPDQRSGVLRSPTDQVPGAEEAHHAAGRIVFPGALVGPQIDRGVVHAEGKAHDLSVRPSFHSS